jgi:hypothetical protein
LMSIGSSTGTPYFRSPGTWAPLDMSSYSIKHGIQRQHFDCVFMYSEIWDLLLKALLRNRLSLWLRSPAIELSATTRVKAARA